jgi:hypothetical protein
MPLSGAMPGWPFEGLLDNATMVATRSDGTVLVFRAYLKKNNGFTADRGGEGFAIYEGGGGIDPERVDRLEGFADRILPDWVRQADNIACASNDLGDGLFEPRPQIRPARGQVEAQTGSYLYGKFIRNK